MARAYELADSRKARTDERGRTVLVFRWLVAAAATDLAAYAAVVAAGGTVVMDTVVRLGYSATPQGGNVWIVEADYGLYDEDAPAGGGPDGGGGLGSSPATFPGEDLPAAVTTDDPSLPDQRLNDGSGAPGTGGAPGEQPDQPGDTEALGPEFSFDTGGRPDKKYYALTDPGRGGVASRYFAVPGATAPNYNGALGWKDTDKGASVEGADLDEPASVFTTTRRVAKVSFKYYRTLVRLTNTVNKLKFFGHDPGELLFMGVSGNYKPPSKPSEPSAWVLTFKFGSRPTLLSTAAKPLLFAGQAAGDADALALPAGQQKDGWDWVEVYFRDKKDAGSGKLAKEPWAFSINRVFERFDFKLLGL